ncbi:MAG: hypothetical protein WAV90_06250, partial [Gordonia amarae]
MGTDFGGGAQTPAHLAGTPTAEPAEPADEPAGVDDTGHLDGEVIIDMTDHEWPVGLAFRDGTVLLSSCRLKKSDILNEQRHRLVAPGHVTPDTYLYLIAIDVFDCPTLGPDKQRYARDALDRAIQQWPDECDFVRAMSYNLTALDDRSTGPTPPEMVARIRDRIATYDNLVTASKLDAEETFATIWELPMVPVQLPLRTRGQVRAAYAAGLVRDGRFAEADAELDLAAEEPCLPHNAAETAQQIATVRALSHFRRGQWRELLTASSGMSDNGRSSPVTESLDALGKVLRGLALIRLRSAAGAGLVEAAIGQNYTAVSAWGCLQRGLMYR